MPCRPTCSNTARCSSCLFRMLLVMYDFPSPTVFVLSTQHHQPACVPRPRASAARLPATHVTLFYATMATLPVPPTIYSVTHAHAHTPTRSRCRILTLGASHEYAHNNQRSYGYGFTLPSHGVSCWAKCHNVAPRYASRRRYASLTSALIAMNVPRAHNLPPALHKVRRCSHCAVHVHTVRSPHCPPKRPPPAPDFLPSSTSPPRASDKGPAAVPCLQPRPAAVRA